MHLMIISPEANRLRWRYKRVALMCFHIEKVINVDQVVSAAPSFSHVTVSTKNPSTKANRACCLESLSFSSRFRAACPPAASWGHQPLAAISFPGRLHRLNLFLFRPWDGCFLPLARSVCFKAYSGHWLGRLLRSSFRPIESWWAIDLHWICSAFSQVLLESLQASHVTAWPSLLLSAA